jgi:hypothetical protein
LIPSRKEGETLSLSCGTGLSKRGAELVQQSIELEPNVAVSWISSMVIKFYNYFLYIKGEMDISLK